VVEASLCIEYLFVMYMLIDLGTKVTLTFKLRCLHKNDNYTLALLITSKPIFCI